LRTVEISEKRLLKILLGVSSGMAHLSAQGIVHRDLAARNVLLGDKKNPQVADFGFSRVVGDSGTAKTTASIGPIAWMAPESLRDKSFSEASDVWAFGILALEVICFPNAPYGDIPLFDIGYRVRDGLLHPTDIVPKDKTPTWLVPILAECWRREPEQRPTFARINELLSAVTLNIEPKQTPETTPNIRETPKKRGKTRNSR
jgi:serine/threonine protein kinase